MSKTPTLNEGKIREQSSPCTRETGRDRKAFYPNRRGTPQHRICCGWFNGFTVFEYFFKGLLVVKTNGPFFCARLGSGTAGLGQGVSRGRRVGLSFGLRCLGGLERRVDGGERAPDVVDEVGPAGGAATRRKALHRRAVHGPKPGRCAVGLGPGRRAGVSDIPLSFLKCGTFCRRCDANQRGTSAVKQR